MSLKQIQVELMSHWGSDRNAAEAAWASSTDLSKLQARTEDDVRRVVTGVVNNAHDTPKERIWMEFFIRCPIFCERQFDKYRMTVQAQDFQVDYLLAPFGRDGITQNELSGRYRSLPDRPYSLPRDVFDIVSRAATPESDPEGVRVYAYDEMLAAQYAEYKRMLKELKEAQDAERITNAEYKRAREVMRGILGTSYMTDMRIVMNMNAFEHIINQRLAKDTQPESRVIAHLMINEVRGMGVAPVMIQEMVDKNGWAPLQTGVTELLEEDHESR